MGARLIAVDGVDACAGTNAGEDIDTCAGKTASAGISASAVPATGTFSRKSRRETLM
jgi:hypothetical protein